MVAPPHENNAPTDDVLRSCRTYERALAILERRWMGLVLRALLGGPRRFNEVLAAVPGITDTLLAQRLRELEANKLGWSAACSRVPRAGRVRIDGGGARPGAGVARDRGLGASLAAGGAIGL